MICNRQTDRLTDARGKTICLPTLKGGDINITNTLLFLLVKIENHAYIYICSNNVYKRCSFRRLNVLRRRNKNILDIFAWVMDASSAYVSVTLNNVVKFTYSRC